MLFKPTIFIFGVVWGYCEYFEADTFLGFPNLLAWDPSFEGPTGVALGIALIYFFCMLIWQFLARGIMGVFRRNWILGLGSLLFPPLFLIWAIIEMMIGSGKEKIPNEDVDKLEDKLISWKTRD